MGQAKITSVIAAPRLRFETINDNGIAWPVTLYSGYVVLEHDGGYDAATEPITFVVPDALPATRPPKTPAAVQTSVRAVRTGPEPHPLHLGAYDARVDFLPDPAGGKNVVPRISFHAATAGAVYVEINYQLVIEDS